MAKDSYTKRGGGTLLFRKNVAKFCAYCTRAGYVSDDKMLCKHKGFVACDHSCRLFRYDPLKRTPPRLNPKNFSALEEQDFSL